MNQAFSYLKCMYQWRKHYMSSKVNDSSYSDGTAGGTVFTELVGALPVGAHE